MREVNLNYNFSLSYFRELSCLKPWSKTKFSDYLLPKIITSVMCTQQLTWCHAK